MRFVLAIAAVILLGAACAPAPDDPGNLRGTFRTDRASDTGNEQSFQTHYIFAQNGTVTLTTVDASGAVVGATSHRRFVVNDRKITIQPPERTDPRVLYLPVTLTYVNHDKLAVDGTNEVLRRIKD